MHFGFVDRVLELSPDRVVTIKQVTLAEEYLQDHFPEFPVLPGVLMVESFVQAARHLMSQRTDCTDSRLVLGSVRALKYGNFVRPGESLRVEVTLNKVLPSGEFEFKGEGVVLCVGKAGGGGSRREPDSQEDARATNADSGGVAIGGGDVPVTAVAGRFTLRPVRLA